MSKFPDTGGYTTTNANLTLPFGRKTVLKKRFDKEWKKFIQDLEAELDCVVEHHTYEQYDLLFSHGGAIDIPLWFAEKLVLNHRQSMECTECGG